MAKIKVKERTLTAARKKQLATYNGTLIKLSAKFSAETLKARKKWHNIFRVMRGKKNLPPRILYPARLSFGFERESVLQKTKAKRVQHH